jgi:rfaE bifunctional protein kinase chain/domain
MSQEEPAIILKPFEEEVFLGGAAIVAKHIKSLGGDSNLFSIVGDDALGLWVENSLAEVNVDNTLIRSPERRTTQKTRYRVRGPSASYSLFRVSRLTEQEIPRNLQDQIFEKMITELDDADALIFSDFNYGLLPDGLLNRVIEEARARNVMLSADSQTSSQVGDIARYNNINLVFATEHEARISLKNKDDGLIVLSDQLAAATDAEAVFLKLGAEGALLHTNMSRRHAMRFTTERLSALNSAPIDVSGAGDAMLAAATMAMAACADIRMAFLIGSLAAAMQVSKTGNPGISNSELLGIIKML